MRRDRPRREPHSLRARLRASTIDVPLRVGERQSARVRALRALRAPTLRRARAHQTRLCAFHRTRPEGCGTPARRAERV